MKIYTLSELAAYLQRVVAMNFQEPIWVRAEILQARQTRGHTYIELVQKDEISAGVAAQMSAVLWSKQRKSLSTKISQDIDEFLTEGCEVSLLVEVNYHSVFGLKLSISDLDPAYTLGRLQLSKQKTIERLTQEKLMTRNASLSIKPVLQRIAVISAPTSAGFQDFAQQLSTNEYGYQYRIELFASAMQGVNVEQEFLLCLQKINVRANDFDCVVIIRGGGSRLDLSAFDQYAIAKATSLTQLPVFTGIGHDTDLSVCDMVSYRNFKTPTAVASYLIDASLSFETQLLQLQHRLFRMVLQNVKVHDQYLTRLGEKVTSLPKNSLERQTHLLTEATQRMNYRKRLMLEGEKSNLQKINRLIGAFDPQRILKRGYVYTKIEGQVIKKVSQIKEGALLQTIFMDGKILSTVEKIESK